MILFKFSNQVIEVEIKFLGIGKATDEEGFFTSFLFIKDFFIFYFLYSSNKYGVNFSY
jgi:hypothetical protein